VANVHAEYMTPPEVEEVSLPILRKRFGRFGFQSATIMEEEDFDGSHVFRMIAHVQEKVPARDLIDALDDIHTVLRRNGEQRFVYLSTQRPGRDQTDEDIE
jgi:hypothetical protein